MSWLYGPRGAAVAALLSIPVSHVTVAFAQPSVPPPQENGQPPTTTTSSSTTSTTTTQTLSPYFPPAGAATNTGPIGGGNATESSARTRTGEEQDTFDIHHRTGEGISVRGGNGGPIFTGSQWTGDVPYQHVVRRGDTLSGICDVYFHNPYQWPRIWSYNPQIQNPHWIYPGDLLRLRTGSAATAAVGRPGSGSSLVDRRRQVPNETVFLRDEGFIEDRGDQDWGEVTGSPEDKMFLTSLDEIYLHLGDAHDVRLGQELTIFRPVRSAATGKVVQIQGTVRVDQWNAKDHVARGQITESLDVIERGARVGPIGRRFQVVPPVRNDKDIQAHIIASVHPHNFYGQNQVVFIDQGRLDGLKIGNRLFIVRKGDAWRRSLATRGAAYRISPESENLPDMERTPGTRDQASYPDEVVGELRILEMRDHSATALVTQSKVEIERDDVAIARRGY